MMVLAATTLMMAVPASSFVPCASRLFLRSAVGSGAATSSCLGHLEHQSVLRRGQAGGATGIRMADELGRIGRLAKDKLFDAKNFIEDSGKADGGINFKGAGAGAVAGGAPPSSCPSFRPHFIRHSTFIWKNVRVACEGARKAPQL
jgi:hypothetical protein